MYQEHGMAVLWDIFDLLFYSNFKAWHMHYESALEALWGGEEDILRDILRKIDDEREAPSSPVWASVIEIPVVVS